MIKKTGYAENVLGLSGFLYAEPIDIIYCCFYLLLLPWYREIFISTPIEPSIITREVPP